VNTFLFLRVKKITHLTTKDNKGTQRNTKGIESDYI